MSSEKLRLEEDSKKINHWRKWGPYLSERQWGTVREDYSKDGDAWNYFPHDAARSRVYRWGEDGIGGISDNHQRLCFALTLWNGEDSILKERLYGFSGKEGNHGEDVKEYYFYLDNTPTHSYMKYLYKYPHLAYPYDKLLQENQKRTLDDLEYELINTDIFNDASYFDVTIEYAKASSEDLLIRITATNHGSEKRNLHLLPTLWFRNTWSWGKKTKRPSLFARNGFIEAEHETLGKYNLYYEDDPSLLFTENDSLPPYTKDAFHRYLIGKDQSAINPEKTGTKCALDYVSTLNGKETKSWVFRLSKEPLTDPFKNAKEILEERKNEADAFYKEISCPDLNDDERSIQRQAFAGMLWNKQFYHYVIEDWLKENGNPRQVIRNADWVHLYNDDILSVPDKWEYSCFFSWDTAFHTIAYAMIDPEYAKRQLILLTREWNMHPNGQVPASEWSFSDVNPPVHAWAAWRVYKIEQKMHGKKDTIFLERLFQKLLMNFTWWVNRKDSEGKNVFQGGFLGLDNISLFNRSEQLPRGGKLYQSDASSWMGMYCLNMLTIALELAKVNPSYEDMASKFFEHFLYIADAINYPGDTRLPLWDEVDGFYYDVISLPDGNQQHVKVRSMVGLIPLFAVTTLTEETFVQFPEFTKRLKWFLKNRMHLCNRVACMETPGMENRHLFSIVNRDRLKRLLIRMLDEKEFLSPYGIRSLSKYHEEHPYSLSLDGHEYKICYEPAESKTRLFGGNSNWRGPIWFPLNMLIIESLQKFHYYFGDEFKVEFPTGSGVMMNLWEISGEISKRLMNIFTKNEKGKRPVFGDAALFQNDPNWDYILFYEYFHGDNGAGLGASHQTGWTGLIAKLLQQNAVFRKK